MIGWLVAFLSFQLVCGFQMSLTICGWDPYKKDDPCDLARRPVPCGQREPCSRDPCGGDQRPPNPCGTMNRMMGWNRPPDPCGPPTSVAADPCGGDQRQTGPCSGDQRPPNPCGTMNRMMGWNRPPDPCGPPASVAADPCGGDQRQTGPCGGDQRPRNPCGTINGMMGWNRPPGPCGPPVNTAADPCGGDQLPVDPCGDDQRPPNPCNTANSMMGWNQHKRDPGSGWRQRPRVPCRSCAKTMSRWTKLMPPRVKPRPVRMKMGAGKVMMSSDGPVLVCDFPKPISLISNVIWERADLGALHSLDAVYKASGLSRAYTVVATDSGSRLRLDGEPNPLDQGLYRCLATALDRRKATVFTVYQDVYYSPPIHRAEDEDHYMCEHNSHTSNSWSRQYRYSDKR